LIDYALVFRDRIEQTLAKPGVRLHKVALGSKCKRARMYVYPDNLPGSTALELQPAPVAAQCVEVDMLTIDYVVRDLRIPAPKVIKIDTQGCELSILQGARETLPKVHVLMLECWLLRAYGPSTPLLLEVATWLRQFDFHLWDLGDHWRNADGILEAQDCLFLNARCPISRLQKEPLLMALTAAVAATANGGSRREKWLSRLFQTSKASRNGKVASLEHTLE
jgi:FkbM family methyltransferase